MFSKIKNLDSFSVKTHVVEKIEIITAHFKVFDITIIKTV